MKKVLVLCTMLAALAMLATAGIDVGRPSAGSGKPDLAPTSPLQMTPEQAKARFSELMDRFDAGQATPANIVEMRDLSSVFGLDLPTALTAPVEATPVVESSNFDLIKDRYNELNAKVEEGSATAAEIAEVRDLCAVYTFPLPWALMPPEPADIREGARSLDNGGADCASALDITCPYVETTGAFDGDNDCAVTTPAISTPYNEVFYRFVCTTTGLYQMRVKSYSGGVPGVRIVANDCCSGTSVNMAYSASSVTSTTPCYGGTNETLTVVTYLADTLYAGTTYWIHVGTSSSSVITALFDFRFDCFPCPTPESGSNTSCATAQYIACGDSLYGAGAVAATPHWYYFTVGIDQTVTIFVGGREYGHCRSGFYPAYSTAGAPDCKWTLFMGCAGGDSVYAAESGGCSLDAKRILCLRAGTYYLKVWNLNVNPYIVSVGCDGPCTNNDFCSNALPVAIPSATPGTTVGAFNSTGAYPTCAYVPLGGDVWYSVVGNDNFITANVCSTGTLDTRIAVYTGDCSNPSGMVCVTSNDDDCGSPNGLGSIVTWCSDMGVVYYIRVGHYRATNAGGPFTLNVYGGVNCHIDCGQVLPCGSPTETEPNNVCPTEIDRTPLTCNSVIYGTICPATDVDVYEFDIPAYTTATVTIYDGATCTTTPSTTAKFDVLTSACVNVVTNQAGSYSVVNCTAVPILDYVKVHTDGILYGPYALVVTCSYPPTNDACPGPVVAIPSSNFGTTVGACGTDAQPTCGTASTNTSPSVWYTVFGNGNQLTATVCRPGTDFDTKLAVYKDGCATKTCVVGNDDGGCVSTDSGCALPSGSCYKSKVTWCSDNGVEYLICIWGYGVTNFGAYQLDILDGQNCHVSCDTVYVCGTPAETEPNNVCTDLGILPVAGCGGTVYGTICLPGDIDLWYVPPVAPPVQMIVQIFDGPNCDTYIPANFAIWNATGTGGICTTPGTSAYAGLVFGGCIPWPGGYIAVKQYTATPTYGKYKLVTTCQDYVCPCVIDPLEPFTGQVCSPCAGPILDVATVSYPMVVPTAYHITDLNVCFDITHTWDGDVSLWLVTPWADTIALTTNNGSSGDNYSVTTFDDEAATSVTLGAAPYNGSYKPEEVLSAVDMYNALGTWWIIANDNAGGDVGYIHCVCLTFTYDRILAVNLNNFDATAGDREVTLNWSTASETDNASFRLMRDGQMVYTVPTEGGATGRSYTYTDEGLQNGRIYTYDLVAVSLLGNVTTLRTVEATPNANAVTVTEYALHPNYPNPFNPTTSITFDLVDGGMVSLKVFNLLGQNVATVVNSNMIAGRHTVSFDATGLPSGLYLYRLEANGFTAQNKMMLLK